MCSPSTRLRFQGQKDNTINKDTKTKFAQPSTRQERRGHTFWQRKSTRQPITRRSGRTTSKTATMQYLTARHNTETQQQRSAMTTNLNDIGGQTLCEQECVFGDKTTMQEITTQKYNSKTAVQIAVHRQQRNAHVLREKINTTAN